MAQLYEDPQHTTIAEAAPHVLHQGRRSTEDYVTDFRCWRADTNWNDATIRYQFQLGLSELLKDALPGVGVPNSMEALINLAVQNHRRRSEKSSGPFWPIWMMPRVSGGLGPAPSAQSYLLLILENLCSSACFALPSS